MKIAFFYPMFYPVKAGGSVHGYNLAYNLHKKGIDLHFAYGKGGHAIPFGINHKRNIISILRLLYSSDLIYLRHGVRFSQKQAFIILMSKIFKKKVVVELNGPTDELLTVGYSAKYIKRQERILRILLSFSDAIITISYPMKGFVKNYLKYRGNVYVIPNGGERVLCSSIKKPDKNALRFLDKYEQIALWSGSDTHWQGLEKIEHLAKWLPQMGFVLIVNNLTKYNADKFRKLENVLLFTYIPRAELNYFIIKCDIGLVIYGDYSWCRIGYYNSSLKYYEYLINGLNVITEPYSNDIIGDKGRFLNLHVKNNVTDIKKTLEKGLKKITSLDYSNYRNWQAVANETIDVMQKIANKT